uniref:GOLD domain-containing protein n=1 Tax=Panagrellus redivivus TaxID=6233 RepID=A0A7E4ZYI9_PANRE
MSRSIAVLAVLLLCAGAFAVQEEYIMAIYVEPGKSECFFQDITDAKYSAFEIDYQVTDGGDHDINFSVKGPQQAQVVADSRKTDANHRIDVNTHGRGVFEFCFDNSFSVQTRKTVFFEMYLLDEKGNYENGYDLFADKNKAQAETSMTLTLFDRITTKVKNSLNRIEQLQAQHRAIEYRDRAVMEHNFERVNFWSLINLVVMVLVGSFQLFVVRSLFEENSKVGRIIRSGKLN